MAMKTPICQAAVDAVRVDHDAPLPTLSHRKIGRLLGLSNARILQLEQTALRKIRQAVEREARAAGVSPVEWLRGG